MKSLAVRHRNHSDSFEYTNRDGVAVGIAVAPGRPSALREVCAVASLLGSGTRIGYLSLASTEQRLRLVILTVLTESGEQVAGPLLSDELDDDEADLIMRSASENDDPVGTLRRFVRFRPDRGLVSVAG